MISRTLKGKKGEPGILGKRTSRMCCKIVFDHQTDRKAPGVGMGEGEGGGEG